MALKVSSRTTVSSALQKSHLKITEADIVVSKSVIIPATSVKVLVFT